MDTYSQSWCRVCNGRKFAGISTKVQENRIELKWARPRNQKAKSSGMQAMKSGMKAMKQKAKSPGMQAMKQKAMQAKTAIEQKATSVGMKAMQQKAKKSNTDMQEKNAMNANGKRDTRLCQC